ncbi:MAG TPA: hypothetical protein VHA14_14265, partial [Bryobacteraceae bacterium]|nr:hypothetical protein [Bryobacteraceae bacterium]
KADVDTLMAQVSSLQNEAAVLRQEAHKRYVDSAVEGKQEETKGARPDVTLVKRIKESDVELQKQLEEAQGKELGGYAAIADKIQGIVDQKRAEGILDEKGLKILQQTEVALNKKYSQTLLDKVRKRDWRDIIKDAQGEDALERGEGKTSAYEFTRQLREDITQGEKDVAADRAARKSSADTQSFQINRSAQQVARRNRLLLAGGEIGGAQAAASNYAAQVSAAQRIFQIEKDRIGIIVDEDVKKREMAAAEKQNADALYQAELQYEQSIDELRERNIEKYRQAAGDIFSALINRQEGPGRALGQLVRGAAIGQAGQIFGNLTSGLIGKAGNALASIIPAASPLAKIFRGTALDPANKDVGTAQVETAQNTADTVAQLKTISKALTGGSGAPGGDGATSSVADTIAAVSSGGGRLASISRAISGLTSGAGSVFSGNALATLLGYGTPGANGNPGTDPSLSQRIGAGLGLAGTAAAGTFGIISGIHQGGAGGALTAAGSAAGLVGSAVKNISGVLGAVSPLLKAIPVVGTIAALALPLIGSFFGQGPVRRQNQLNQELSSNQYIAPQALNVTEDPGGHFADFDARGNLRTSSFSPYPTVRQGMVWEQTHGLFGPPPTYYNVPGGQTGQFGPAAPAAPMIGTLNLSAIDSQSGADFLMKNSHAVAAAGAKALQDGHQGFAAEVQHTAARG